MGSSMNTPYLHLMWKEYRANRLFWIAIVVLAVLLGLLMNALLRDESATANVIFNLALGAPFYLPLAAPEQHSQWKRKKARSIF